MPRLLGRKIFMMNAAQADVTPQQGKETFGDHPSYKISFASSQGTVCDIFHEL
jgi:hypothetical protein